MNLKDSEFYWVRNLSTGELDVGWFRDMRLWGPNFFLGGDEMEKPASIFDVVGHIPCPNRDGTKSAGVPQDWEFEPDPEAFEPVYAMVQFLSTEIIPDIIAEELDNDHMMEIDIKDLEGDVIPGRICRINYEPYHPAMLRYKGEATIQGMRVLVCGLRTRWETEGG